MKRKIIQIADSTMLVSLPRPWTKVNKLQKGQEIDVTIDKNKVIISCDAEAGRRSIKVDISKKVNLIENIIGAAYRAGYDEVEIHYSTAEEHGRIYDVVNKNVIGMEIVDDKNKAILIKSVSSIDAKEFDVMLRRGFLFLLSMADDSLALVKDGRFDELAGMVLRDNNINRISDFCKRALNKHGHKDYPMTNTIYAIVIGMERLGDEYKTLAHYTSKESLKPHKETIELFKAVNKLLRDYYECFYNFDLECVYHIIEQRKKLTAKADLLLVSAQKDEVKIIAVLNEIIGLINHMANVLMVNSL